MQIGQGGSRIEVFVKRQCSSGLNQNRKFGIGGKKKVGPVAGKEAGAVESAAERNSDAVETGGEREDRDQ